MTIKMLSDESCEELAEIIINFAENLPNKLMSKRAKAQIGASHSLIISGIRSNRDAWEEMLKRFHYWMHTKDVGISEPKENGYNKSKSGSNHNGD